MAKEKHIRFDWAIKRLLRQKANFTILEGFLTELLMFDVTIDEILESESNREGFDDKSNRVDILARNQHNQLILIEVQNEKQHDYFHRMNYGQAKLISEYINSGDTYDKVSKVYSINIVYFELGQGKDYIYIGKTDFKGMHNQEDVLQLSDKQKELYASDTVSDLFANYYIIKINNFNNKALTTLDQWIYFLKNNEIEDSFEAQGIQEAKQKLRIDNLAGSEKTDYEDYIKLQRNRESEIKTAFYDGQKKAHEKLIPKIEEERRQKEEERRQKEEERRQKEEAKQKLAQKMKKYGESITEIIKETGLSKEEIEKL